MDRTLVGGRMTDIQDAYEDFCASITDKTETLPAYKFFEAGYKAGWNAAVKETKKACAEAIDLFVGSDGFVCVQPDEIKNVIMQVEVT